MPATQTGLILVVRDYSGYSDYSDYSDYRIAVGIFLGVCGNSELSLVTCVSGIR